jgi:hypothetical protein
MTEEKKGVQEVNKLKRELDQEAAKFYATETDRTETKAFRKACLKTLARD